MWNQQYKGAKTESCAGGEKGLCVHVWQGNTSRDTQDYLRDEIDESKFDCHKYNREICGWILTVWRNREIDRGELSCGRDVQTLLPIIQQYIRPGSSVHSDEWRTYSQLQNHHYSHQTVNHLLHFNRPSYWNTYSVHGEHVWSL